MGEAPGRAEDGCDGILHEALGISPPPKSLYDVRWWRLLPILLLACFLLLSLRPRVECWEVSILSYAYTDGRLHILGYGGDYRVFKVDEMWRLVEGETYRITYLKKPWGEPKIIRIERLSCLHPYLRWSLTNST